MENFIFLCNAKNANIIWIEPQLCKDIIKLMEGFDQLHEDRKQFLRDILSKVLRNWLLMQKQLHLDLKELQLRVAIILLQHININISRV